MRELIDRNVVRDAEFLLVGYWLSEVLDAMPYGIFPFVVPIIVSDVVQILFVDRDVDQSLSILLVGPDDF